MLLSYSEASMDKCLRDVCPERHEFKRLDHLTHLTPSSPLALLYLKKKMVALRSGASEPSSVLSHLCSSLSGTIEFHIQQLETCPLYFQILVKLGCKQEPQRCPSACPFSLPLHPVPLQSSLHNIGHSSLIFRTHPITNPRKKLFTQFLVISHFIISNAFHPSFSIILLE